MVLSSGIPLAMMSSQSLSASGTLPDRCRAIAFSAITSAQSGYFSRVVLDSFSAFFQLRASKAS